MTRPARLPVGELRRLARRCTPEAVARWREIRPRGVEHDPRHGACITDPTLAGALDVGLCEWRRDLPHVLWALDVAATTRS